jgi:hypothetical protein
MITIAKDLDGIEILARGHIAQREGDPDHGRRRRVDQVHILNPLIAQAPLVESGHQRRGCDLLQLVVRLRRQIRHRKLLAT